MDENKMFVGCRCIRTFLTRLAYPLLDSNIEPTVEITSTAVGITARVVY